MDLQWIGALLAVALLAIVPLVLQHYIQRLPVAPSCPCCSATTHAVGDRHWSGMDQLPALMATFIGECSRCGWRGRMRWRWATRTARGGRG